MTKRERKYIVLHRSLKRGYSFTYMKFVQPKIHIEDLFVAKPWAYYAMLIPKHASYIDKRRAKWNKYGGKHFKHRRVRLLSPNVKPVNRIPLKLNIPIVNWSKMIKGE